MSSFMNSSGLVEVFRLLLVSRYVLNAAGGGPAFRLDAVDGAAGSPFGLGDRFGYSGNCVRD